MAEVVRVLKDEGLAVMVEVQNPHSHLRGAVVHNILYHLILNEKHYKFPGLGEIYTLFIQSGLKITRLEVFSTWKGKYSLVIGKR
jgi:ubiquinone/menaquinone biosynthesis C-methylase UbiE